ncbi:MAG: cytochrome b/b6 domain-containing protein [Marinibacterium sp.]
MTSPNDGRIWVRRQTVLTRLTHWIWAVSLFFLLLSGLQIFNAHPTLYLGDQSGFDFDNAVLAIGADGARGYVDLAGWRIDTTGTLGWSGGAARAFPAWATIPSQTDLATGRVIHFFFAWSLVGTLLVWLIGAMASGHLWRDLVMRGTDWRRLGCDLRDHLHLRFHRYAHYGPLQKLSYGAVLFGIFPLILATGLAMSPGMNAALPWLPDILGGRQTARTLHFLAAAGLGGFVIVHLAMVLVAGPVNELRAMITGWYLADTKETGNDPH